MNKSTFDTMARDAMAVSNFETRSLLRGTFLSVHEKLIIHDTKPKDLLVASIGMKAYSDNRKLARST